MPCLHMSVRFGHYTLTNSGPVSSAEGTASKLPGLKASRYSLDMKPLGPGKAPYFCIFEAEFENEAALMGALASKEGQAVAGDVPNYASGGVTMVHFAVG